MAKKLNDIQTTNKNNLFEKTDYNTKTAEIGTKILDQGTS